MKFKVDPLLYSIPEIGLHCYLTFLRNHPEFFGMHREIMDPCFLIRHEKIGRLDVIVVLKYYDGLEIGYN